MIIVGKMPALQVCAQDRIMAELDTGLPSIRQLQSFIKHQQEIELKLLTDDLLVGKILWQDENCLCLVDHYDHNTIIWRQALVYIKTKP
jgi:host factor-I protein